MKKNHKFTPMRRLIFFLLIGLVLVQLPAQWAVVGLENNPFLTTPTLESTQENNPKASGLPPGTGAGACDNLLRLSEDLSLPNGVGRQLRAFFDSKPPGVGVKAWEDLFDFPNLRVNTGALNAKTLAKGSRPNPNTYLDASYITNHLNKFDDGAIRFTTQTNITNYGTLGPSDAFTMPKSEFDNLFQQTGGNFTQIENALGLNAGTLSGGDAVIAWVKKEDFSGLKMPWGNEGGVNPNWLPGGVTPGGLSEAVLDLSNPNIPYTTFPF